MFSGMAYQVLKGSEKGPLIQLLVKNIPPPVQGLSGSGTLITGKKSPVPVLQTDIEVENIPRASPMIAQGDTCSFQTCEPL
jgi:hypothetical protein